MRNGPKLLVLENTANEPTEIAKYSGFVAKEFEGDVDLWATLNEPLAVVLAGYLQPGKDRTNPPAVGFQGKSAKAVTMAMITGQARMYDAVKANDTVDADGNGKASEVEPGSTHETPRSSDR